MHVKASLATAALAATGAAALNTHRHKHANREIGERYARAQQERALEERGLIYKHTSTHIVTEVVTVYTTCDTANNVAPTAAFFEPGSSDDSEPTSDVVDDNYGGSTSASETEAEVTEVPEPEVPEPEVPATTKAPAEPVASAEPEPEPETTTSVVSTPPATGGLGLPCKRGIAYNNVEIPSLFTSTGRVCWGYNWGADGSLSDGAVYIPTLWGEKPDHMNNWETNIARLKAEVPSSNIMFSFNEADFTEQAGALLKDHGTAAARHIEKLGPYYKEGWNVGAPSVTSNTAEGADMSWNWLEGFMGACNSQASAAGFSSCPVSFVNTHYYEYDATCDSEPFKKYITEFASRFSGFPVFVTEVQAINCDQAGQVRYIQEISEWMDSSSLVAGYAYFYGDGILTDGTTVNSYGQAYIDA